MSFAESVIANLVGGACAAGGGLLAVRYQLRHGVDQAAQVRAHEREEEALLLLDSMLAGAQLRIARSFGDSDVWVPPMRSFPGLETFHVSEDDPEDPIDNEGIRDCLHEIERSWQSELASRIRVSLVRDLYSQLRELAFLFGRRDFLDVRILAKSLLATLSELRTAIAAQLRVAEAGPRKAV
jgi:hypothetical protein